MDYSKYTLEKCIWHNCKTGKGFETLKSFLRHDNPIRIEQCLNAFYYVIHSPSKLTPLMIASHYGRYGVVKLLLETGYCNVEAEGIFVKRQLEQTCTALYMAIKRENLAVLKLLVEVGKADVNHKLEGKCTTAVKAACHFNNHTHILKYLIESGADTSVLDNDGLLEAIQRHKIELARYILNIIVENSGAQDKNRVTSPNLAAKYGYLQIIELLIKHGVKRNAQRLLVRLKSIPIAKLLMENNLTVDSREDPNLLFDILILAAYEYRSDIIDYFIENCLDDNYILLSKIINNFEIIGSLACIDFNDDVFFGYELFNHAMRLRFKYSLLKTNIFPAIAAYEYQTECTTFEELDKIKNDQIRLAIEGFLISERMWGVDKTFLKSLRHFAQLYKTDRKYQRFLEVYLYAYHHAVREKLQSQKFYDLSDFHIVLKATYWTIKQQQQNMSFPTSELFLEVFQAMEQELPKLVKVREDDLLLIYEMIFLFNRMCHANLFASDTLQNFSGLIHKIVRPKLCVSVGYSEMTLLHLAAGGGYHYWRDTIQNISASDVIHILKFLLHFKNVDIDAFDYYGNTPLHICIKEFSSQHCTQAICKSIGNVLLEAGAHTDYRNKDGKTATDLISRYASDEVKNLLNGAKQTMQNLKCLCARMAKMRMINSKQLSSLIGEKLTTFVKHH